MRPAHADTLASRPLGWRNIKHIGEHYLSASSNFLIDWLHKHSVNIRIDADDCEHYLYASSNFLIDWQHNHSVNISMDADACEHHLYDASNDLIDWQHNHSVNI